MLLRLKDFFLLVNYKNNSFINPLWIKLKNQILLIKINDTNNIKNLSIKNNTKNFISLDKTINLNIIVSNLNSIEKEKFLSHNITNVSKKIKPNINKDLFFFVFLTPIFFDTPLTILNIISRNEKRNFYSIYNIFNLYYQPFFLLENINIELLHTRDNISLSNFISIYYYDFYFDKIFQNYKLSFSNLIDETNYLTFYRYYDNFSLSTIDNFFLFLQTLYIKKNFYKSIQYIEINFYNRKFLIIFLDVLCKKYYNIQTNNLFFFSFKNDLQYFKNFFIKKFKQNKLKNVQFFFLFFLFLGFFSYNITFLVLFFIVLYKFILKKFLMEFYFNKNISNKKKNSLFFEHFCLQNYSITQYNDLNYFQYKYLTQFYSRFDQEANVANKLYYSIIEPEINKQNFEVSILQKHFFYFFHLSFLDYFDFYQLAFLPEKSKPPEDEEKIILAKKRQQVLCGITNYKNNNEDLLEQQNLEINEEVSSYILLKQTYNQLLNSNNYIFSHNLIIQYLKFFFMENHKIFHYFFLLKLSENFQPKKKKKNNIYVEEKKIVFPKLNYYYFFSFFHLVTLRFLYQFPAYYENFYLTCYEEKTLENSLILYSETFINNFLIYDFFISDQIIYYLQFNKKRDDDVLPKNIFLLKHRQMFISYQLKKRKRIDFFNDNFFVHFQIDESYINEIIDENIFSNNNNIYYTPLNYMNESNNQNVVTHFDYYYRIRKNFRQTFGGILVDILGLINEVAHMSITPGSLHNTELFLQKDIFYSKNLIWETGFFTWQEFLETRFLINEQVNALEKYKKKIYYLVIFELEREKSYFFNLYKNFFKNKSKNLWLFFLQKKKLPRWLLEKSFYKFEIQKRVNIVLKDIQSHLFNSFQYESSIFNKINNNRFQLNQSTVIVSKNNILWDELQMILWSDALDLRILLNFHNNLHVFLYQQKMQNIIMEEFNNNILKIDNLKLISLQKFLFLNNYLQYESYNFTYESFFIKWMNLKQLFLRIQQTICFDFELFWYQKLFRFKIPFMRTSLSNVSIYYYYLQKYPFIIKFEKKLLTFDSESLFLFFESYSQVIKANVLNFIDSEKNIYLKNTQAASWGEVGEPFSPVPRTYEFFEFFLNNFLKHVKENENFFLLRRSDSYWSYRIIPKHIDITQNAQMITRNYDNLLLNNNNKEDLYLDSNLLDENFHEYKTLFQEEYIFPLFFETTMYNSVDFDIDLYDSISWI